MNAVMDFFSPVPSWAEKYLALKGDTADKPAGALFSYCFSSSVIGEVTSLLIGKLWMKLVEGDVDPC